MTLIGLEVNFRSEAAIYTQIVEQVQKLVMSGTLKPGDQLPTVRQLAAELRVNFNTVARAYRILDDLGLISTQQGRGTYIWEPGSADEAVILRQKTLEQITRQYFLDAITMGFTVEEIKAEIEQEMKRTSDEATQTFYHKENK
ncbi:MAG TPA: GntR family transcriptional regulator [Bellilinea sp.]|nr:GntR family transcriptional regulator [Bellilinea sp.]